MNPGKTESRIALGIVKGINADIVRRMAETGLTPEGLFTVSPDESARTLGLSRSMRFSSTDLAASLERARKEVEFVNRHSIRVYSLFDDDYPWLLRQIPDAPVMLFQLGEADLNVEHMLSMVGTRRCTKYGLDFCSRFVADLGAYFPDLTVVSGLAFGIDAASHTAAIENNLPTVAVMAHGLDTIYPSAHRDLARRIIHSGGAVLSEYLSGTTPFAARFLERNRIVAGLSRLSIVVESEIKGGAMSTANYAFSYNRDVMALPGRITDSTSGGCNLLIRKEKAHLVTAAADVIELMDWRPLDVRIAPRQRNLFPELSGVAGRIYEILKFEAMPLNVDVLFSRTGIPVPELMSALTDLEFDGIITRQPGNRYSIS